MNEAFLSLAYETGEVLDQHTFLQRALCNKLREDYTVSPEYHLKYVHLHPRAISKQGQPKTFQSRGGRIDLFVEGEDNLEVAVEFDAGNRLKWRSLEKLFQCPARICIGIVNGKQNKSILIDQNHRRIQQVYEEMTQLTKDRIVTNDLGFLQSKTFWLVVLRSFYAIRINNWEITDQSGMETLNKRLPTIDKSNGKGS